MIQKDHIVIFPFMAKGHTIPLVHFATSLPARNIRVTFVTTPANAPFLRKSLPSESHPDIDLVLLPFPHCPPLPSGCESTDQLPSFDLFPVFVGATTLLRRPFERLLQHLITRSLAPPLCLVSDFFLGWTLDACDNVGLPRVVFHGMSTFAMTLCKSLWLHLPDLPIDSGEAFHVPGTPSSLTVTRDVIPDDVMRSTDTEDPGTEFLSGLGDSDVNSWGVLVNSCVDVDREEYVGIFESFYRPAGARAWLVGPLSLLADQTPVDSDENDCLGWLGGKAAASVVYVSFGTQAHVSEEQLDEVAYGLEESGYDYLWVVRSETWSPPPPGRTTKKGKIVSWAPQGEVLEHVAVGGFLSHCGWNSVMDGISAGVPFLTWPMIAEQQLNAKHLVDELGVGMRLMDRSDRSVGREDVRDGVRELMGSGERGMGRRNEVVQLSKKAKSAVADGGSSRRTLDELIDALRLRSRQVVQRGGSKHGERVAVEELQLGDP